MNYRMLGYLLGIIMMIEAALLALPTLVSILFREAVSPFLITKACSSKLKFSSTSVPGT